MIIACAHIARTDAPPSFRQGCHVPACWMSSAAGQPDRPAHRGLSRQRCSQTANAVWVHAHPGFKSPSLRCCC